jgi:phosphoribosyl 1,2-cyclic phosphodiesterase
MKVQLWGIRGSLPSPHTPEEIESRLTRTLENFIASGRTGLADIQLFMRGLPPAISGGYGGNTACVEVSNDQGRLIIDAGSGIRRLSDHLLSSDSSPDFNSDMSSGLSPGLSPNRGSRSMELHILFTHFHWDHLIGLPFFAPIFASGNKIHLYAVQPELEDCIRSLFQKPFFPVPFESLRATINFHTLEPRRTVEIAGMRVTPYLLDHPDPCWGYRIESSVNGQSKVYAHCVDTECTRVTPADLGPDLPLYRGADLVLFDAQYTLLEAVEKMNWGHSAAPIGLELALREGVKRILFAHHDPGASDEKIADAEKQTQEYVESYRERMRNSGRPPHQLQWGFAREGQVITL